MVDVKYAVKGVLGLNPKTNEEAKADFNKQKKRDALKFSDMCDNEVKTCIKCFETIKKSHANLIKYRHEMELAINRSYDGKMEVIPISEIDSEVNTRFLNLKKLEEALKVDSAESKKEAQQLLVVKA